MCFRATIVSPLRSKRAMISPVRPFSKASGLTRIRVRSIGGPLGSGEGLAGRWPGGRALGGAAVVARRALGLSRRRGLLAGRLGLRLTLGLSLRGLARRLTLRGRLALGGLAL